MQKLRFEDHRLALLHAIKAAFKFNIIPTTGTQAVIHVAELESRTDREEHEPI